MARGEGKTMELLITTIVAVIFLIFLWNFLADLILGLDDSDVSVGAYESVVEELRIIEENLEDAPTGEDLVLTMPVRINENWKLRGISDRLCLQETDGEDVYECATFSSLRFTDGTEIAGKGEADEEPIQNVRIRAEAREDTIDISLTAIPDEEQ